MLEPGSRIGRYLLDKPIGLGGMAATFLCTLDGVGGFQKHVILKIMRPEHRDDDDCRAMFLDEARLCARLQHPNIVQVFELGDFQGLPYLVMEYVRGPSLLRLIKRLYNEGPPPQGEHYGPLIHVFMGVLSALGYAGYGEDVAGRPLEVVHRDVSLGNILVSASGSSRLIDFGIAKTRDRLSETQQGVLKGKMQYMAPEAVSGRDLDPRADIFSLGVCLYVSATGHYPFTGDNLVEVWKNRTETDPVPPSELCHDFPPGLSDIIVRSMCKDVEQRYQHPDEMRQDLLRLIAEQPALDVRREGVAAWMAAVFPEGDQAWNIPGFEGEATGQSVWPSPLSDGDNSLLSHPGAPRRERKPVPPAGRFTLVRGIALGALVVSVFGFALLLFLGPAYRAVNPDVGARALVEESNRLLVDGDVAQALALLQRANQLNPTDPNVLIDLSDLTRRTRVAVREARGRRLIELGDLDGARMVVRELFDSDPNDAVALELLGLIRTASDDTGVEVGSGKLVVRPSTGGVVFVDDMPFGQSPVTLDLTAGTHRVDVRLAGHTTYSQVVNVAADETVLLKPTLFQADAKPVSDDLADLSAEVSADRTAVVKTDVNAEPAPWRSTGEVPSVAAVEGTPWGVTEPPDSAPEVAADSGRVLVLTDGRSSWDRSVASGLRDGLDGLPLVVESRVPSGIQAAVVIAIGGTGQRRAAAALPGTPTIAVGTSTPDGLSIRAARDPDELAVRIRQVLPRARRVGVVASRKAGFWESFSGKLYSRGGEVNLKVVGGPEDVSTAVDELIGESDVIVIMPDAAWTSASIRSTLSRARGASIPTVSYSLVHLDGASPATFVYAPDPIEMGRLAAAEARVWRGQARAQHRRGTIQAKSQMHGHSEAATAVGLELSKRSQRSVDSWR